jgi:hypothetical protein
MGFADTSSETELRVVESFSHTIQAELVCAALRGSGIEAVLYDNHIVSADWFLSNAVGGVKVLVPAKDLEQAHAILAEGKKAPTTADKGRKACASCGGTRVTITNVRTLALFHWLRKGGRLMPRIRRVHCAACGVIRR